MALTAKQIRELKEKRQTLVVEARKINDAADAEKRQMTPEEESKFNTIMDDADKLDVQAEREERLLAAESKLQSVPEQRQETAAAHGVTDRGERAIPEELKVLHRQALRAFIGGGGSALTPDMIRAVNEVHSLMEVREMSAFGAAQSVMLAPQEWTNEIIKDLTKRVAIRQMARVLPVNTLAGIGVPTLVEDTEEFDMTAELTAPSAAADISLGKRELRPHQASKLIKLPTTLLQSSAFNIEALAGELMAGKFARTEDNKYCNGSGAQEPLGLFTASAFGIDTDRDVVCGTATDFTWDGMIDIVAALREEYQPGSQWLLARNAWVRLRKIKDGDGNYIWEPSVRVGEPNVILGYPYQFSDFVPSTYTSGLYVGIFGNFQWYWIIEFAFTYVQKLLEAYALTNQIGLIGRRWFDGAPVQPKAFVRMKLG